MFITVFQAINIFMRPMKHRHFQNLVTKDDRHPGSTIVTYFQILLLIVVT